MRAKIQKWKNKLQKKNIKAEREKNDHDFY